MRVCSRRMIINTQDSSAKARSSFMARKALNSSSPRTAAKRSRRGALSVSSIASYFGVFLLITALVATSYQPMIAKQPAALANASTTTASTLSKVQSETGSVDPVVAANIASSLADTTNMPVSNNVANLSQSLAVETMMARTDSSTISKPQVVNMTADSRSATTYVTQAGDTLDGVAEKYGLQKTTVAWANNLSSDALEPNVTLTILPTDGVLYTTKDGDTLDGVAEKYGGKKDDIVTYNDLELASGVASGTRLIIPGGTLPENERPGYTAPTTGRRGVNANSNWGAGTAAGAASSYKGVVSAGNRYAWGNCTWYAYERRMQLGRPVGSFWGNASTWAYNARSAGLAVNGTPAPGAVMANGGGYGHVAIVESVNPGVSVTISEMNGYRWGGGFNRVGRGTLSWSEATSGYYSYIH